VDQNGDQEDQQEIVPSDGKMLGLPSVVQLPASAENIDYSLQITQTPSTQRIADIEEKKKDADEKRLYKRVGLITCGLVLLFCLWIIFFDHPSEQNRQLAEKIAFGILLFLAGNNTPKLTFGNDIKKE
jgi:hypothetical protein